MQETWRWFGLDDPISIGQVRQTGAAGIVSALHEFPTGAVWPSEAIAAHKLRISTLPDGSPSGLSWDVVESLPVSEDIKLRQGQCETHIRNYVESLRNLGANGLKVVCYNFMPVLDWTRTQMSYSAESGAKAMRFDEVEFAVFDIYLLGREGADTDYSARIVSEAEARHAALTGEQKKDLIQTVIAGLPGAEATYSLPELRQELERYQGVTKSELRENMKAFLEEVIPVAAGLGMRMCCHPDDPPFSLLGLPRIISTEEDLAWLCAAVDDAANGITLCAGSLGAGDNIDLAHLMKEYGSRVHFLHLRNTTKEEPGETRSFFEAEHLAGDTDLPRLIYEVLEEEARRERAGRDDVSIPFRPDHGQEILTDLNSAGRPGYPLVGRTKGLAELRGVIAGLKFGREEIANS